uniref:SH3 domain-binding protein 5-like isoform X4 n=2 Tax=Callospermophilus lateralis TaxID=76772 RepID=UPI0040388098
MAEFRQVPGGRETPQGELRPEVVEDEIPRSPVAEEPGGGGGSNSSESKLSPREEEELDPRIQEELEHLNQASEEINQVELQLDEARTTYRRILQESARKLNTQGSHLGSCIEKARPYYEARRLAKEAQQETQKAALRYERAVSMHNAAREMVFVAEQGVMADKNRLDPTWQEMLNHATCKVNEAEEERLRGEREHQRVTRLCQQAEARVQALQKTLRRAIGKSRPYFELKAQFSQILEEHKAKVTELEQQVAQAKTRYSVALRNLEQISEQIHARRRGLPAHPPGFFHLFPPREAVHPQERAEAAAPGWRAWSPSPLGNQRVRSGRTCPRPVAEVVAFGSSGRTTLATQLEGTCQKQHEA